MSRRSRASASSRKSSSTATRAARRSSTSSCASCGPATLPPPRSFQRTVYRPGELIQLDLTEPRREVPVGWGQTRKGYIITAKLPYSRAFSGALIFSKESADIASGMNRCLTRLGAIGADVTGFKVGDSVGCMGANAASHAELVVVPEPLTFSLPEGLDPRWGRSGHWAASPHTACGSRRSRRDP